MKSQIAYCGLVCEECPIFIVTKDGDEEAKEKLAKECSTEDCSFSKKDMNCQGCHTNKVSRSMCGECPMRICGKERDVETCGSCTLYPCGVIEEYVPKDSENRKRLDAIAEERTVS